MTKSSSGNTNFLIVIILLGLLLIISAHCSKNNLKETNGGSSFKISIASGGGFTGLTTGYNLYSDGKIEYWQRMPAGPDSVLWVRNVEAKAVKQHWKWLNDSGLLETELNGRGNMTTYITYSAGENSYSWSFAEKQNNTDLEKNLKTWCQSIISFCEKSKSK